MNRIYHPYTKWEDYPAGFYNNISGEEKIEMIQKVIDFFNDEKLTIEFMNRVCAEWVFSCEHNLTNASMNKIAYIGQAACCLYAGIPATITMEAWSKVEKPIRERADKIAQETLLKWGGVLCQSIPEQEIIDEEI